MQAALLVFGQLSGVIIEDWFILGRLSLIVWFRLVLVSGYVDRLIFCLFTIQISTLSLITHNLNQIIPTPFHNNNMNQFGGEFMDRTKIKQLLPNLTHIQKIKIYSLTHLSQFMIFSIPRSKSFIQYFSYQKHHDLLSQSHRHQDLPIRLTSHQNKSKQLMASQSECQAVGLGKYKESPKKQLIYNKCRSKSYDKYLIENKKKVQKQIILKNLNPEEKRIYQDSEENKKIYSGKKLVDPINQKFNYFIKPQQKQQIPFVISQFLLEPCKINSKRLEHRPFTSQSFINITGNDSNIGDLKKKKHVRNRTSSSMARTYQNSWRVGRNESICKINENMEQFSTELVSMGSKFRSRQFGVEPWQLEPTSNNLDSIRMH